MYDFFVWIFSKNKLYIRIDFRLLSFISTSLFSCKLSWFCDLFFCIFQCLLRSPPWLYLHFCFPLHLLQEAFVWKGFLPPEFHPQSLLCKENEKNLEFEIFFTFSLSNFQVRLLLLQFYELSSSTCPPLFLKPKHPKQKINVLLYFLDYILLLTGKVVK